MFDKKSKNINEPEKVEIDMSFDGEELKSKVPEPLIDPEELKEIPSEDPSKGNKISLTSFAISLGKKPNTRKQIHLNYQKKTGEDCLSARTKEEWEKLHNKLSGLTQEDHKNLLRASRGKE